MHGLIVVGIIIETKGISLLFNFIFFNFLILLSNKFLYKNLNFYLKILTYN